MEGLQFGEISDVDFERLMSLYRELQPNDTVLSDDSDLTTFKTILASEYFFLMGLRREDTLIGSTYVNIVPNITRGASPYAVIENVIITSRLRNRGDGKFMMKQTLNFIWSKGCYKAMLQTGSKSESVHAFYRSCGFSGTAKFGYAAYPDEQVI